MHPKRLDLSLLIKSITEKMKASSMRGIGLHGDPYMASLSKGVPLSSAVGRRHWTTLHSARQTLVCFTIELYKDTPQPV